MGQNLSHEPTFSIDNWKPYYVNPRLCGHRTLVIESHGDRTWATCTTCGMSGDPVGKIWGRFNWLAKNRALSAFYRFARRVDKEDR